MKIEDLIKLKHKFVFLRTRDGFGNFIYLESIDNACITGNSAQGKFIIVENEDILSVRELSYKEKERFLSIRNKGELK